MDGITLKQLAESKRIKYDSLYRKARRRYPSIGWTADTDVSPDIALELVGKKSVGRKRTIVSVKEPTISSDVITTVTMSDVKQPTGEQREGSAFEWPTTDGIRTFFFDSLCIGIVIGHAGLIWYDCSEMWSMPGIIGGGIAFLIVLATVLLSTDATRVRTSSTAIWTVFILDCAAWFVHYPTFQRYATIGNLETGAICGFLCLFSFMALYIFRDSKLD